ncbi:hypothetical protein FRC07_002073 [Ceratobasidium sp. 392]|nr:hypothetical protein FRC07_002073 [Ceratobasidium sp. 392]
MLDDITFVSSALERDPAHLLEDSRGKGKGRAGAFMYKLQGETVEEERTVIKQYSKRTSTSDDCGQSSHPTTVTLSTKRKLTTTIKRKATIESLLNEPSKKPKRRDSTPVVSSQVKQPTEGTTKLFSTFAPVLDVQGMPTPNIEEHITATL